MGLTDLLPIKKPKQKEDEAPKDEEQQQEEELNNINNANVAYPFYDVKATSFPPPLSVDASVYANPTSLAASTQMHETDATSIKYGKQEVQKDEKTKEGKIEPEVCDTNTCTKDKSNLETCPRDDEQSGTVNKIGQDKLKEMINDTIKEAMETIVKQCRMDKEEGQDKKSKEDPNKSVCYRLDKSDYRPRQRLKDVLKSDDFREKYGSPRSKKLHDTKIKDGAEEARCKKRPKLKNNVRTDNRRMTGNVNIYICSEANENTKPIKPQKPEPPPCMESSSETTTEQSKICSSKLVTCIRNKRRKFQEQRSLNRLCQKAESSEDSNSSSLVSKSTDSNIVTGIQCADFINVCHDFDKLSVKDTESSLTECECKDSSNSDRSDQSFKRSKFVMCDKIEKPCSTIYPSKRPSMAESDEWSSKSVCSNRNDEYQRGIVLCDRKRDIGNYCTGNSKEDYGGKRKIMNICLCRKQNREPVGDMRCNCGDKRRRLTEKENFMQPLSTCTCIAEEEEDDVGVDSAGCRKSPREPTSVCTNNPDRLKNEGADHEREKPTLESEKINLERGKMHLESPKVGDLVEIKKAAEERMEDSYKGSVSQFLPSKIVRPEVVVLRNILKHQGKPVLHSAGQTHTVNQNSTSATKTDVPKESSNNEYGDQEKREPSFLKKFNIRDQQKFIKRLGGGEEDNPPQKTENKETEVKNQNEEDKGAKPTIQTRMRGSFLYKSFKKAMEKKPSPEKKSEKSKEEDKTGEDTKDNDDEKKAPKTKGNKEAKEKEKLAPIKNMYKMISTKKSKPKSSSPKKMSKKDDKDDSKSKPEKAEKDKNLTEETPDDATEKQEKSNLPANVDNKESSPALINDIKDTKKLEQPKPQTRPQTPEKVIKKIEPPEPLKAPEIQKSPYDQEKKPEIQKPVVPENIPMRNDLHPGVPTIYVPCTGMNPLNAGSKQYIHSQCSQIRVPEPQATCTNPRCIKCANLNQNFPMDNERYEENRCNCCCQPVSQCTDEFMSHPKSCLKKERQFRCANSPEINPPIVSHDKRNWGECGCRRILFCDGCRKPRAECSCRVTYVSCTNCCKPRSKCSCKSICKNRKSTICLYCDQPRENCRCRAPVRKCSCCELSLDLCRCEDQRTICEGRPVLAEQDNDRTMYVTAWKPREEIRRYFSRNLDVPRTDSINECWCFEKLKHHNSDDLPYQRLSVFSDVMDELQQKMSESACCTRCRKTPCCCNIERDGGTDERKIKCCISPKTRRKLVAVCMEKPKVKSSNHCKCDSGKEKSDRQRKIIVSLCCLCKSTPCRCKRSKPSQKKPRAKCYYCKNSPCICIATGDCNKPRPCRCTDSPCRTKEKDNAPRGKISTKPRNNDEKIICVR